MKVFCLWYYRWYYRMLFGAFIPCAAMQLFRLPESQGEAFPKCMICYHDLTENLQPKGLFYRQSWQSCGSNENTVNPILHAMCGQCARFQEARLAPCPYCHTENADIPRRYLSIQPVCFGNKTLWKCDELAARRRRIRKLEKLLGRNSISVCMATSEFGTLHALWEAGTIILR